MLALLATILPGVLLPAFKAWIGERNSKATHIAEERMAANRDRHATTRAAMAHKAFWCAWGLFAFPLGFWWAAVIIDSTILFSGNIPDLPENVKPWAEQIFNSLFWSGAGMGGVQVASRAAAHILSR